MNCIKCNSELPIEIGVNDICTYCGKFNFKSFGVIVVSAIYGVLMNLIKR